MRTSATKPVNRTQSSWGESLLIMLRQEVIATLKEETVRHIENTRAVSPDFSNA
jgi:hypothetical protein